MHHDEGHSEHERDRDRDDQAGSHPKADEADNQNDAHGLEQGLGEPADCLLDDDGLIGHEMHAHADWQFAGDPIHLLLEGFAERQEVRPGLHADGQADGGLAIESEQRLWRVEVSAADGGDVA